MFFYRKTVPAEERISNLEDSLSNLLKKVVPQKFKIGDFVCDKFEKRVGIKAAGVVVSAELRFQKAEWFYGVSFFGLNAEEPFAESWLMLAEDGSKHDNR
jgi:hypothetical protein